MVRVKYALKMEPFHAYQTYDVIFFTIKLVSCGRAVSVCLRPYNPPTRPELLKIGAVCVVHGRVCVDEGRTETVGEELYSTFLRI